MNITRDVITDLWPLYLEDAVSLDTRALVEEFLAQNPEWAATLRRASQAPAIALPSPTIQPGQEARSLNRIKRRFRVMRATLLLAMVFTFMAFGRIVSDTSFDVSPRRFIATAAVAGVFWIAFLIAVLRCRRLGP